MLQLHLYCLLRCTYIRGLMVLKTSIPKLCLISTYFKTQPHVQGDNKFKLMGVVDQLWLNHAIKIWYGCFTEFHYDDITWMLCSLKSLVIWLFVWQLIRTHVKETSKSALLALCEGIHRWPVNSPHKGPVTWKKLPFDDAIMLSFLAPWIRFRSSEC